MSELLSVSLPDELSDATDRLAAAQGRTRSEIVRDALRSCLWRERWSIAIAVDPNVLVSAVIADGPPRRAPDVIPDGAAELVLPQPVRAEPRRVLSEKLARSLPRRPPRAPRSR